MPTQIVQRQILDGAINDAKVQAGAGIQTSKLQDGAEFLKRDGSIPLIGNLNANGNKVTNLGTPTAATDGTTKSYVDTAIANTKALFDAKDSVRVATTVNGVLATAFANGQIVNGVTLATGDRVLIKDQTVLADNGIYTVNSTGAPTRATDFDAWTKIPGATIPVEEGTVGSDFVWLSTANQGGTVGTTSITFTQVGAITGLQTSNFVDKELPSGAINGVNTAFVLAFAPTVGTEHVYLNGVLQESGAGNDYTISGSTITMLVAPLTGEKLRATYRK